jgi:DNA-binding response OmpR family regulator
LRLLLVANDAITIESIKLCLEISEPASILEGAYEGKEALQKLRGGDYDCVLIDLGLPDMDGTEVIEQLRTFSQMPAIAIGAKRSQGAVSRALSLGADDYIAKPFDSHDFLKSLNRMTR